MQIYGSPQNQQSFAKYGLEKLDRAELNYRQAFQATEVYLGEEFRTDSILPANNRIIDYGIDQCRRLCGEAGVEARITLYLGRELGRIIAGNYFSLMNTRWQEIEEILGYQLDHYHYNIKGAGETYRPNMEVFADIFNAVLNEQQELKLTLSGSTLYVNEELCCGSGLIRKITIKINLLVWRKWIYSLWGQKY